jgi:predicted RNase H-like HicB family nuclease
MFSDYMRAVLERAQIEELADSEGYFASIPELSGVWGNATTEQGALDDLREALEVGLSSLCSAALRSLRLAAGGCSFR